MASEHDDPSSQNLTDINVFGGNEISQAGDDLWPLPIPHNGTPSAAGPLFIRLEFEEHGLKAVGTPLNHQAAARRRKKDGIYQCPFRHAAGCSAAFTARHNLRYHINAHWGLKPYRCIKCSYAAASPANIKRHQATCKGIAEERNDMVPKQDYPPSQELADIQLTDRFHFSFGGNEISHPGDDLWSLHIPADGAAGPPRLPPIATPSPQSSVGASAAGPPVIKMEAVDDDIMAAELSRIQQAAVKRWEKDDHDVNESVKPSQRRGKITARSNSTMPCTEALQHREKRTRRRKRGRKHGSIS